MACQLHPLGLGKLAELSNAEVISPWVLCIPEEGPPPAVFAAGFQPVGKLTVKPTGLDLPFSESRKVGRDIRTSLPLLRLH